MVVLKENQLENLSVDKMVNFGVVSMVERLANWKVLHMVVEKETSLVELKASY